MILVVAILATAAVVIPVAVGLAATFVVTIFVIWTVTVAVTIFRIHHTSSLRITSLELFWKDTDISMRTVAVVTATFIVAIAIFTVHAMRTGIVVARIHNHTIAIITNLPTPTVHSIARVNGITMSVVTILSVLAVHSMTRILVRSTLDTAVVFAASRQALFVSRTLGSNRTLVPTRTIITKLIGLAMLTRSSRGEAVSIITILVRVTVNIVTWIHVASTTRHTNIVTRTASRQAFHIAVALAPIDALGPTDTRIGTRVAPVVPGTTIAVGIALVAGVCSRDEEEGEKN